MSTSLRVPSLRGFVVLVVDDSAFVLDETAAYLRTTLRCDVLSASSADEALSILDAGAHVDLVFSDVCMPGKDGLTLADAIRETYPTLPVVLITGRHDMVPEAIEKGAVPLLKPCSLTRLAAVFVDQLRVSPGDDFM